MRQHILSRWLSMISQEWKTVSKFASITRVALSELSIIGFLSDFLSIWVFHLQIPARAAAQFRGTHR